jgi:hypothetical protein
VTFVTSPSQHILTGMKVPKNSEGDLNASKAGIDPTESGRERSGYLFNKRELDRLKAWFDI